MNPEKEKERGTPDGVNAPKALVWTTEKPTGNGYYWISWYCAGPELWTVPAIYGINGFPDLPHYLPVKYAGPIPEPLAQPLEAPSPQPRVVDWRFVAEEMLMMMGIIHELGDLDEVKVNAMAAIDSFKKKTGLKSFHVTLGDSPAPTEGKE